MQAEFADLKIEPLTGERLKAFQDVGKNYFHYPTPDSESARVKARAAYRPASLPSLPAVRGEFSLDGNWLFMPEQDMKAGAEPAQPTYADQSWHVLPVPSFWTPSLTWLHGEAIKGGRDGIKAGLTKRPSDRLLSEEYDRVNAQTFAWESTMSGWYRHHLELPQDISGRKLELIFDAVAKICDVYVNGQKVGSHTGMFSEVKCDITAASRPGKNLIAVYVVGIPKEKIKDAKKVQGVAVTVDITNEMLQTLPHGIMSNNPSGIWQPVRLLVSNPVRVDDVFVRPRTDGLAADIALENASSTPRDVEVSFAIQGIHDASPLFTNPSSRTVSIPAKSKSEIKIEASNLQPKLWSPQEPNLYMLNVKLSEGGKVLDDCPTTFGFRTFVADGDRFLLNGKPYWLRGGNHFPAALRPNDSVLARRFLEKAREGNVWATRSVCLPFTRTWLDAADQVGMAVSQEGTWPWLMLSGEVPSGELLKIWKDEFASLIRQWRNHPSLLIWTVSNEMNFPEFDKNNIPLMKRKWAVLDDMIRTIRQIDPTRLVCAYSGYLRAHSTTSFNEVVEPNHFDDGDIDDAHRYFGWYNPSFYNFFEGEYGKKDHVPGRPLISQEMSTGYPRDDGWPVRSYQFSRYVPQALVGDYAFEEHDPAIFLKRQAFTTKELGEVIRRTNRAETAGVMHFAYLTWFTEVWNAERMRPIITYYELKKALQPVLVSAELYGRHFYAGDKAGRRVCIVNDSDKFEDVPAGKLIWEVRDGDQILSRGTVSTPAVKYYANQWFNVDFQIPSTLPRQRVDARLVLKLEAGGKILSENDYEIMIATRKWAAPQLPRAEIQLYDPHGNAKSLLAGYELSKIASLDKLSPSRPLVVGDFHTLVNTTGCIGKLRYYVEQGGKVLLLHPGNDLPRFLPDMVKSYRVTKGEIVSMQIPESPIFDGIQPLDTAWFEMGKGNLPYACGGTYEVDRSNPGVATLASECKFHPDIPPGEFFKWAGSPIVEISLGKGTILVNEMMLSAREQDPVARRLLNNMLRSLCSVPQVTR